MNFKQNRDSTYRLAAASIFALGLCLAGTPAFAQDAAPADTANDDQYRGLEAIVVQARKVDENLQDVPVAVTVLSGDDLADRNVQQVQDLANFTPGLLIRSGSNTPSALTVTLRG